MDQIRSPSNFAGDAELVRSAQAGERAAFDQLAERYRSALLAMAFMRTSHKEDAEDLVQEVLATAWQKLPSLQDPQAFAAWIKTIAMNACHTWYRRRVPWPQSLDATSDSVPVPDFHPGPLEVVLAREKQREWRQALLMVPEANRLALLMHIWGDASYEQIASFLGVPVTTVEGRIHRAKMQLRRLLRDEAAEFLGEPRCRWGEKRTKKRRHSDDE